jgi:hypothetical protein
MTSILLCTCSGACQVDGTCARLPRFQAYLDTAQNAMHPRIHRCIEACANHLGTMAVAMATWAREQDLTHADLVILAIEPPLHETYFGPQHRHRGYAQTSGFVFSVIHLSELEGMSTDVRHASFDATGHGHSVRRAGLSSDRLPCFGLLTADGSESERYRHLVLNMSYVTTDV